MKFCAIAALIYGPLKTRNEFLLLSWLLIETKLHIAGYGCRVIKVINCDMYGVVLHIWYTLNIAMFSMHEKNRGKWYLL